MLPSRKGQGGAAILIALIAALIILYVLFLPPADRAELLGEPSGSGGTGGTGTAAASVIYTSPVGRVVAPLSPISNDDLGAISIRVTEAGGVIASRSTVTAESNVFQKANANIAFSVDPKLTRNVYLSLAVRSATGGNLVVRLNGVEIYNRPITQRAFAPLELTNIEDVNDLEISASSVGFAFWKTNRVTISDVKVTADVTDLSSASASQRFVLTEQDLRDVKQAQLSFVPICQTPGPISLSLNGASLYEGTPDCENLNTLEIAPTRLVQGENTLAWRTASADILIDLARVSVESNAQANKAFSFQIDPAKVAGRPILLRIAFADTIDKQGYVTINGNRLPISGGSTYGMPITTALRPGANTISFEAIGDPFEIVRFEVLRG